MFGVRKADHYPRKYISKLLLQIKIYQHAHSGTVAQSTCIPTHKAAFHAYTVDPTDVKAAE